MATASVNNMVLWTDLEGTELNGRWKLVRQVRSEGRTGWFEAKDAAGQAVMLIITETLNDEEELMERLRAAAMIQHPHVVRVEDSVVVDLEDTPMVVAVTEVTEENLGDVLRERSLGAEETRQVLDALVAGLAAIHARGLVHGRMEPGSVLATGDTIKLRSDCLQMGGANFAAGAGEDVRGLGRIVVQALTRRIPANENDPVMQLVPEPMARAVRRALSGRASVEEIATLAGIRIVPRSAAAPPAKEPVKAAKPEVVTQPAAAIRAEETPQKSLTFEDKPATMAVAPASAVAPAAAVAPAPAPAPAPAVAPAPAGARASAEPAAAVPTIPSREETSGAKAPAPGEAAPAAEQAHLLFDEEESAGFDRRRAAPWIVVAAVALVVITAFVLYGMMHRSPARQPVAPAPAASAAPVRATSAARPAAAKASSQTPQKIVAPAGPGWRVVAYTYDHRKDAEQKAKALQERYPQLTFSVFAPHAHGHALVTVGGVLTKGDAQALRQRAVRMGLPRDTYAQNFR